MIITGIVLGWLLMTVVTARIGVTIFEVPDSDLLAFLFVMLLFWWIALPGGLAMKLNESLQGKDSLKKLVYGRKHILKQAIDSRRDY